MSPVISTILMVAITVVLAATAFVLVADVGGQANKPVMQVGITADDGQDLLEVTAAGQDANWRRVILHVVKNEGGGNIFVGNAAGFVNQPADLTGLELVNDRTDLTDQSLAMVGGDVLFFCREGGGAGAFEVQIVDQETNGVVGTSYRFGDVGACP